METEMRSPASKPEIWGGMECTCNRVNDSFFDQLNLTGHYNRPDDIREICALGIRRMRYPILWELHQPHENTVIDWSWTEARLGDLFLNNVIPIAGLLHHGSGPAFTRLDDPYFPAKFARYAGLVARKFPQLEYYTPINEPLTTARFSGLYGLWYPHHQKDASFIRMLINQLKGIVLAMGEIRKINPGARLIQTEDLGKTYSTPLLSYQAQFENERRWLSFDLLCGLVDKDHPLWNYLLWAGLSEHDVLWFQENQCRPDIAGFNYYLTSERFIDEDISRYPKHLWGGNLRHRYADVEAIRINHPFPSGLDVLLREAWLRFGIPMAVTEVFLSCTPEEQVRWLYDVSNVVGSLALGGIDVRATTVWALLGEYGWNNLVTSPLEGEYEPGVFDIRHSGRMSTQLAEMVKVLTGVSKTAPELIEKGWWSRQDRFIAHKLPVVVL
jgi:dTDP-4-dehydrorhamnose reductase